MRRSRYCYRASPFHSIPHLAKPGAQDVYTAPVSSHDNLLQQSPSESAISTGQSTTIRALELDGSEGCTVAAHKTWSRAAMNGSMHQEGMAR